MLASVTLPPVLPQYSTCWLLLKAAASAAALVAGRAAGDAALGASCSPHEAAKQVGGSCWDLFRCARRLHLATLVACTQTCSLVNATSLQSGAAEAWRSRNGAC